MSLRLKELLDRAVWAPSGDNAQPWVFRVDENTIVAQIDPLADASLYNNRQRASYISLGAVVANIQIAAGSIGYKAETSMESVSGRRAVVIRFSLSEMLHDELSAAIEMRHCNRRKCSDRVIPAETLDKLQESGRQDGVEIRFATNESKDAVALACSVNEQIVLENSVLHDFLFDHITWTAAEDSRKAGFFVRTLELNPIQRIVFRIYSTSLGARVLNRLGFSALVSRENGALYASSSAIAGFAIKSDEPDDYIRTGMAMQRLWLCATSEGIAVQPLAGITLLAQYLKGENNHVSPAHAERINEAYHKIQREFDRDDTNAVVLLLRLGFAPPATARTKRAAARLE